MNKKLLSNKFFICLLWILSIIFSSTSICLAFSLDNFAEKFYSNNNNLLEYTVLLRNGDVISGKILDCVIDSNAEQNENAPNTQTNNVRKTEVDSAEALSYILIRTFLGEIKIYEDEIIDIKKKKTNISQNHSLYIMPTANPIGNNHFIGNYELVFLYGGIGVTDWVSLTAGHSMIPLTNSNEQISVVNAKVSLPVVGTKDVSNLVLAVGGNLSWINAHNRMLHLFGIATYNSVDMNNSNFSAGIFYKLGSQDYATVRLIEREFYLDYPDGVFGICLGLEKRFEKRNDLSFLLEIWNSDVVNAANTAVLLGLRFSREKLYTDFGLSFFTQPFVIPFFSFVWMPFN